MLLPIWLFAHDPRPSPLELDLVLSARVIDEATRIGRQGVEHGALLFFVIRPEAFIREERPLSKEPRLERARVRRCEALEQVRWDVEREARARALGCGAAP
ncbi:MAG: hypothetical protein HYV07_18365 [Deltaproteobacteria bacterium]|nr:hypothetical protein [Deltaproteobacteria bacterium]